LYPLEYDVKPLDIENIAWPPDVEGHDYPAAESCPRIIYSDETAAKVAAAPIRVGN
jgi:hypothetical protein